MADHGKQEYAVAEGNDYAEHEATYEAFLKLTKWAVIAVTLVLLFLFFFVF